MVDFSLERYQVPKPIHLIGTRAEPKIIYFQIKYIFTEKWTHIFLGNSFRFSFLFQFPGEYGTWYRHINGSTTSERNTKQITSHHSYERNPICRISNMNITMVIGKLAQPDLSSQGKSLDHALLGTSQLLPEELSSRNHVGKGRLDLSVLSGLEPTVRVNP